MGTIAVEIPDEILTEFGETSDARARFALEALVIEAYRRQMFTRHELAAILGMRISAFDEFLLQREIPDNTTVEQLEKGYWGGKKFIVSRD